jgi:hypothetical protein
MVLDGHPMGLLREELSALTDLANSIKGDRRSQDRALAAAGAKAYSPDARYVLALYQLEIGRQRTDDVMRAQALDALIASGLTPSQRLPDYLGMRGFIAFEQHDFDRAGALWSRQLQLKPGDASSRISRKSDRLRAMPRALSICSGERPPRASRPARSRPKACPGNC